MTQVKREKWILVVAGLMSVGQAGWGGELWLGVSWGGTQLVGVVVEYRLGEVGLVVNLGSAVPWRLGDLSLAVQARQYLPGGFFLGLGGWWFLVREAGQWGWLTSWHLAGGWGAGAWEAGLLWHHFLAAHWAGVKKSDLPSLVLPQLTYKWRR